MTIRSGRCIATTKLAPTWPMPPARWNLCMPSEGKKMEPKTLDYDTDSELEQLNREVAREPQRRSRRYFPSYYYGAAFYGWAYNPWVNPIAYGWGWGGNPWYGYYGAYFTPYPVYAAPSLWLTDYLIANSLQAAYQAQVNAAALSNPAPLTPETKQLIADEV